MRLSLDSFTNGHFRLSQRLNVNRYTSTPLAVSQNLDSPPINEPITEDEEEDKS